MHLWTVTFGLKVFSEECTFCKDDCFLQNNNFVLCPNHNTVTHVLLLHRYRIVSELGRGTFCTVFLLQDTLLTQRLFACKVIPNPLGVILQNDFKTSHATIHNYYYHTGRAFSFLIQERLVDILPSVNLHQQSRLGMLRRAIVDVASGLCSLHSQGIVHADIKRSNLMYRPGFSTQFVLIDYGNAISFSDLTSNPTEYEIVSPLYRAPEILSNDQLTFAIDIWALGLVLIELAAYRHPFETNSRLLENIQGTLGLSKPQVRLQLLYWTEINDTLFINLLERMLRLDPKERITAKEICDHPFCCLLNNYD